MGRAILCIGRYATTPYRFEKICMNVWCVEEVCYLFLNNPFMIDNDVMDKRLAEWVDRECGLAELSHQLFTLLHKGNSVSVFVNTILEYTGYCSIEEQQEVSSVLRDNAGLSEYEKKKRQADYLVENKKPRMALEEYRKLLFLLPVTETELRPWVHHNMGAAYTALFSFEKAAGHFKEAFRLSGAAKSGIEYLSAMRQYMSEADYIEYIAQNPQLHDLSLQVEKLLQEAEGQFEATDENRKVTALEIYKEEGNVTAYYEEIEKICAQLKEEYRSLVEV